MFEILRESQTYPEWKKKKISTGFQKTHKNLSPKQVGDFPITKPL